MEWLKKLRENDYILVYTGKERMNECGSEYVSENNAVQMEFKKWIGTLNLGYFELFNQIHKNFIQLIRFFHARMPDWKEEKTRLHKNMLEIGIYEKLKLYRDPTNKEFSKDEICATYYLQGMNDFDWKNKYEYSDWQNIQKINLYQQKILSTQIYELLNQIYDEHEQEKEQESISLESLAQSLMKYL